MVSKRVTLRRSTIDASQHAVSAVVCLLCASVLAFWAVDSRLLFADEAGTATQAESVTEKVAEPPPPTFAQQPYRVQVSVFVDAQTAALHGGADELARQIQSTIATYANSPWTFPFTVQATITSGRETLKRLTAESLAVQWPHQAADKVLFVEITRVGQQLSCATCEWDCLLRSLGELKASACEDSREVVTEASVIASRALRRVVEVETRRGNTSLRGRGSQLSEGIGSSNAGDSKPVILFQPFYRFLNRQGEVEKVTSVPWTFISAEPDGNEYCGIRTISGLRQPLAGRRRRVQVYGLEIPVSVSHSTGSVARLQFVSLRNRQQPVVGLEVDVYGDQLVSSVSQEDATASPSKESATETPPKRKPLVSLLSDRSGAVRLDESVFGERFPLYWLMIRRGRHSLARIPVVVAVAGNAKLEISDDSLRSQTAIDLSLLESDLVDAVARRAIVMARCRLQMRSGNLDSARAVLKELDTLPGATNFQAQLESIRLPAIELARTQRDRAAEAAIRKLCEDTSTVIAAYLSEDKRKSIVEEIQELEAAKRAEAAPPRLKPEDDPPQKKPAPKEPAPKAPPPKAPPIGF